MKTLSTLNTRLSTFAAYILIFTALCGCKSTKEIIASARSRAEHTATTTAAEPPNTTLIFTALGCVIILVIAVFAYLRRRH